MVNRFRMIYISNWFVQKPLSFYIPLLVFLFSSFFLKNAFAVNKSFTGPGNFSDAINWNGGTLPITGDNLDIDGTCTIDNNALTDNVAYGTLTIGNSIPGTLNWDVGGTNRLSVQNIKSNASGSS